MKLGSNQLIASISYGLIFLTSIGLCIWTDVTGRDLLNFYQVFAPIAVGSILIPSAAIKMKNGRKSDNVLDIGVP